MNGNARERQEARWVKDVCESIGYGRTMQLAEQLWRAKLEPQGMEGGEHSVGCCVTFLVPCGCVGRVGDKVACDWCCGSGRVTKRVRQAQQEDEKKGGASQ